MVLCHDSMEKLILLQKLYIQKVINIQKKTTRFERWKLVVNILKKIHH